MNRGRRSKFPPVPRRRSGAIFITAMGIIVILTGLVLVFARNMRTESMASANRVSFIQADAVEQGAEQWVMAMVDANPADAITIMQTPAEAVQVGSGYFWILRPDADSDQQYDFGISDEAGKLNLNTATSDQLGNLPGMTPDVADAIYDWRNNGSNPTPEGAESDYYESLQEPYAAKNSAFETVEELMLVKGMTPQLLFGYDANRDGVLDEAERSSEGMTSVFNSGTDAGRGFFNDVTCWSIEPNTATDGTTRANVNDRNTTALIRVLRSGLSADRANQIMARVGTPIATQRNNRLPFANIGAFYVASGMTGAEFGKVADKLTTSTAKTLTGLINVNTASEAALMCLPGLTQADADTLIGARSSADLTNIAWVFTALSPAKAQGVAGSITARSYIYSADIVAVSGDGRSYKRVRIVVDGRQTPSKIVYRRDLGSYGWALPPQIRQAMRSAQPPPTGFSASSGSMMSIQ